MQSIEISDQYIKLGQALKLSGLVSSGVEAKNVISEGIVKVNDEIEERRGKKLYDGDIFEYNGISVKVKSRDFTEADG